MPFEPLATHVPGLHGALPVPAPDHPRARFENRADPDAGPGAWR